MPKCLYCAEQIESEADICPYCKEKLPKAKPIIRYEFMYRALAACFIGPVSFFTLVLLIQTHILDLRDTNNVVPCLIAVGSFILTTLIICIYSIRKEGWHYFNIAGLIVSLSPVLFLAYVFLRLFTRP